MSSKNTPLQKKKILSIFDVTPTRPLCYTELGYAISPYYTEELNLKFLDDIINIFNETNWVIYFKQKRTLRNSRISNSFIRKQNNLTNKSIKRIDPNISAKSLIMISDAVISLPFSSPSIIAAVNCVPSVFYDASGDVKYADSHHGIPLLRSKIELKKWSHSLNL